MIPYNNVLKLYLTKCSNLSSEQAKITENWISYNGTPDGGTVSEG